MNSFLKGALTGTMGAADKYGQIQDEQRKFQTDQTKASAADMRKRRYAEFDYELKDSFSGSGQMKEGAELSKRELKEQPEGAALESKTSYGERMKAEQEAKAEAKYQTKLGESREYQEGKATEAAETKGKAAKKKEDDDYLKDVKKNIRRTAKEIDSGDGVVDDILATIEEGDVEQDQRFLDSTKYKEAKEVMRATTYFMDEFEKQKGVWKSRAEEIKATKEALIKRGAPKDQIDKVVKVLTVQEQLK